jgi:hypothetical protein
MADTSGGKSTGTKMMTVEIIRDQALAKVYALEQLSLGRSLATLVRQRLDFSQGHFAIAVPAGAKVENLAFEVGGICSSLDSQLFLASEIKHFLKTRDGSVILQHAAANFSDPWLKHYRLRHFAARYEKEVYFRLVKSDDVTREDLVDVVKHAGEYPLSVFFSTVKAVAPHSAFSTETLLSIAEHTVVFAVNACDGETYLFWRSNTIELENVLH